MAKRPVPAPRSRSLDVPGITSREPNNTGSNVQQLIKSINQSHITESLNNSCKPAVPLRKPGIVQKATSLNIPDGDFQQTSLHPTLYQKEIHEEQSVPTNKCYAEKDWSEPSYEFSNAKANDVNAFTEKVEKLKAEFNVFGYLLTERGASLKEQITELQEVADSLDKVSKGTKIAGITGGTAGAVGVAAAIGGVVLAPLTMGASLAVTAAGVGVAAVGTVTGASAAITNKVCTNNDRKKVELILKSHMAHMEEINRCVHSIKTRGEELRKYDLSEMQEVECKATKMVKAARVAAESVGTFTEIGKSTGMIKVFATGMDMYFSKEDKQKLKKGAHTKFAKQIRQLASQMETTLTEMMSFKKILEFAEM